MTIKEEIILDFKNRSEEELQQAISFAKEKVAKIPQEHKMTLFNIAKLAGDLSTEYSIEDDEFVEVLAACLVVQILEQEGKL